MKKATSLLLFLLVSKILWGQVIITEVFADPTPQRGLPDAEFLEIYNLGTEPVSLKGYTLIYGQTRSAFPDSTLQPHEYAILCRSTFAPQFKEFGKVIAMPNLSLNNSGALLRILNAQGLEIHFVSYSNTWYTSGRNEGYSLEMIDLSYSCRGKENWSSTLSSEGGTPGKPNSVLNTKPDTQAPILLEYSIDNGELTLVFDEILDAAFANDPNNFVIIKGNSNILSSKQDNSQREIVHISLDSESADGLILHIYGATDCSGNVSEDLEIEFHTYGIANVGEIFLSEVLFNPKTGGSDFVEIYNASSKILNLKGWMLAHLNTTSQVASHVPLSVLDKALFPMTYLAFTTDKLFLVDYYPLSGNIIELPRLPSYNNTSGTVLLLRPDSTVYESFTYSEKMHHPIINNPDGVSLEKVSFNRNDNRWTSASSTAGFATPGSANSQSESEYLDKTFTADPIVFNPYQNSDKPYTQLKYHLSSPGNMANIKILDREGRPVRNIGNPLLLGTAGNISWDGTDDNGKLLPVGYYVFHIELFGSSSSKIYLAKTVIGSF